MVRSIRSPRVGAFVWTFDETGLGQISAVEDDRCTIRFFKSANESFELDYDIVQVEYAYLPPHTRVFVRDEDGSWTVGRILDCLPEDDGLFYYVRFPNRQERTLSESELLVRCFLIVDDPAAVLSAGGMETQYFHDRRRAVLECLSQSRAASYGLTGLLSASVELLPHQIDVVRRVLNDRLQRYLLADEVGLGKTIEACAVIRQAIYDNPSERVVVLAPASLTGQWTRELSWRFFVETPKHQLRVLPFEELHNIDPSGVDTLVIDEAHNLISDEPSFDADYQAIELLSSRARRLLLISATPVLGNERTLLALLHLLDPQNYQLDEEDAFREKVRNSQEFGRLLLALNPDQPAAFLRRTLNQLKELIPSDELSGQLVVKIEHAMDVGDASLTSMHVASLHQHIAETYRLHQRLIRTRRRDLTDLTLSDRNSVIDTLLEDEDERSPNLVEALDQWRNRSLEGLADLPSQDKDEYELAMVDRNARLHEALGISVEACGEELAEQLNNVKAGRGLSFNQDEDALEYALQQVDEDTNLVRNLRAAQDGREGPRRVIQDSSKIVDFLGH